MPRKENRLILEEDPNYVERYSDGTLRRGLRIVCCDEDVELFRQGYKCLGCTFVLPDDSPAFPAECPTCGFGMAKYQAEDFAATFKGWRPMGSQVDWDEEMDRMERDRDARLRAEGLKSKGIWVPDMP